MSTANRKRRGGVGEKRGVALILALLFVVILTVIVVEFAYEAQVDASYAFNQSNDLEAYLAAKSAVALGMGQLAEHLVMLLEGPGDVDMPGFVGEQYDSKEDPWAIGRPFEPINNATMRTSISDEFGKINLNALIDYSSGEPQERTFLIEALRFFFWTRAESDGDDPVDAILDWLDYDDGDNERPDGAENPYYLGLERPYYAKNGPMDSLEELLLIKGISPEMYFGNMKADPPILPLSEYLTVHGDWSGAVNVNTARPEVIEAISYGWSQTGQVQIDHQGLLAELDFAGRINSRQRLDQYVRVEGLSPQQRRREQQQQRRQRQQQQQPSAMNDPFHTAAKQNGDEPDDPDGPAQPADPNAPMAPGGQLGRAFTISSNAFRIYGDGLIDDIMVRIEAYVWRMPLDLNELQRALPPGGQGRFVPPEENFRILSWKVIR